MSRPATLRVYYDLPEAQLARSLLLSAGIPADLPDHHIVSNAWHYIVALGGIRLVVHEQDVDRAESLLNAPAPQIEDGDPIDLCPQCGAEDVFRPASFIAAVLGFLWAGLPLLIAVRRRHCRACGQRWYKAA